MTSRRNNRTFFLSQAGDSVLLEIGGRAYGTLAHLWMKTIQSVFFAYGSRGGV